MLVYQKVVVNNCSTVLYFFGLRSSLLGWCNTNVNQLTKEYLSWSKTGLANHGHYILWTWVPRPRRGEKGWSKMFDPLHRSFAYELDILPLQWLRNGVRTSEAAVKLLGRMPWLEHTLEMLPWHFHLGKIGRIIMINLWLSSNTYH
jgi:hypothetical protein